MKQRPSWFLLVAWHHRSDANNSQAPHLVRYVIGLTRGQKTRADREWGRL